MKRSFLDCKPAFQLSRAKFAGDAKRFHVLLFIRTISEILSEKDPANAIFQYSCWYT